MGRLLVVDDAMLMRHLIRQVATEAGWDVVGEAENGREGVQMYEQLHPDLVTLDIVMPEMGGLEALRLIRELDSEARVVMLTALSQKQTLETAIALGAMDFLVKPFDNDRLRTLLAKVDSQVAARLAPERGEL